MAVSSLDYAIKFYPLVREPDSKRNYALTGRWVYGADLLGDGSGGTYLFSPYIGLTRGLFPSPMMADIRWLSFYDANGDLGAGASLTVDLYTGDYCFGSSINLECRRTFSIASSQRFSVNANAGELGFPFPRFLFPISRETNTFCNIIVNPNTAGHTIRICTAGYIYDERYLDVPPN